MRAKSWLWPFVLLSSVYAYGQGAKSEGRVAFAKALATIKSGMTKGQVREVLGEPDHILDEVGCMAQGLDYQSEAWLYGTDMQFGFPTLGTVTFSLEGLSDPQHIGYDPVAIADGIVGEEELRKVLRLMYLSENSAFMKGRRYDPLYVVKVANTFISMGKGKSLAAIREYARLRNGESTISLNVYNAVRAAFTFPQGTTFPAMIDFSPGGKKNAGDAKFYRTDPLVIVDDVPFSFAPFFAGYLINPGLHALAAVCEQHGTIRDQMLVPTSNIEALPRKIEETREWASVVERERAEHNPSNLLIRSQVVSLIRTASLCPEGLFYMASTTDDDMLTRWNKDVSQYTLRGGHWNDRSQSYVDREDKELKEEPHGYISQSWHVPGLEDYKFRVLAYRSLTTMCLSIKWEPRDGVLPTAKVRIFLGEKGSTPFAELIMPQGTLEPSMGPGSHPSGDYDLGSREAGTMRQWYIGTGQGKKISVHVEKEGRMVASPIFDFSDKT